MLPLERQNKILELLAAHQALTVEELCGRLYSSGPTIRRDLQILEKNGLLTRTHGGAVLLESSAKDSPAMLRESQNTASKARIADRARALVQDGDTLFLDSSTTACQLAMRLTGFQHLRVITNGLKTADILSEISGVRVYGTGGRLRENAQSFVGSQALAFIAQFHADLAFFSCRGLHPDGGITDSNEEEADIKKAYIRNAARAVLLCDESKLGRQLFCRIGPVGCVWRVVCDVPLGAEYTEKTDAQP